LKRIITLIFILALVINVCACGVDDITDQVANISQMEEEHVLGVKGGSPSTYPNKTYGEAFENFFASPTWKYFVGTKEGADDDGDGLPDYTEENVDIVEFTGYCTYQDVEVKALIQFTLSKDDDTFSATYLSFNDVPQNMFMLYALLEKVFEDDSEAESTDIENISYDVDYSDEEVINEDSASENIINEDVTDEYNYEAMAYSGTYEGWGGFYIYFSAYSSVEDDEIGIAEIYYGDVFIDSQPVYLCYDEGNWGDCNYTQLFVMHMDGYDEYLGFYVQDGVYMLDYNSAIENYDTLEMIEHYES
jgi:hypothetical protein